MKCRACGNPNGRRRYCCGDHPVFCDTCEDLHVRRSHPEPEPEEDDDE